MNRNILIGAGFAAALMLVLLLLAGGSQAPVPQPAPRSVADSPIQKVAFMTQGSAPAETPKTEHK